MHASAVVDTEYEAKATALWTRSLTVTISTCNIDEIKISIYCLKQKKRTKRENIYRPPRVLMFGVADVKSLNPLFH